MRLRSVWARFTGGLTTTKQKVLLSTTIGFILYCLLLTVVSYADILKRLWQRSPAIWSGAYLSLGIIVLGATTTLLAGIWRKAKGEKRKALFPRLK